MSFSLLSRQSRIPPIFVHGGQVDRRFTPIGREPFCACTCTRPLGGSLRLTSHERLHAFFINSTLTVKMKTKTKRYSSYCCLMYMLLTVIMLASSQTMIAGNYESVVHNDISSSFTYSDEEGFGYKT